MYKLTLAVDVELHDEEVQDESTIATDLEGEVMKVKSGIYENWISGNIVRIDVEHVLDDLDTIKSRFADFLQDLDCSEYESFPLRLLSGLADCADMMPPEVCNQLKIAHGSPYSEGVLKIKEFARVAEKRSRIGDPSTHRS